MKSEVSSEYLYHFTSEINHVINILKIGFKPFYCLESLDYLALTDNSGKKIEMAYPMVCFCDLSEDKQTAHKSKFGRYSIALKKSWGESNYLTPVVYCSEQTLSATSLKLLIKHAEDNIEKLPEFQSNRLRNALSLLLMHYKPYQGFSYNKTKLKFESTTTRFYDEREWRYIPLNIDGLRYYLCRPDFENIENREFENREIQRKNTLQFSIEDIKYVNLVNFSEVKIILRELKDTFKKGEMLQLLNKIRIVERTKSLDKFRLHFLKFQYGLTK
jgi:uncharacterized protein Smg (DUF494 family)